MLLFCLFFALIIFFFICSKLFLSSYIKNPVKYVHLQIRYFSVKVVFSSSLVFLFCFYNEDLKKLAIVGSLVIFIVCHFIEGFVIQRKIVNNVEKK
tara:strand:- start:1366 stop:1653 length:288 start_codon:yes stop_codon:yes gene_type:complete